jgi:hypothetical protein
MTMKWNNRTFGGKARLASLLAAAAVVGCASQAPTPWPAVQATDYAKSAADHEGLAVQYESQAESLAAAARRHEGYAAVYRRNTSQSSGRQEHLALAEHCEKLARTYQQAAYENLALAKLYRTLAAGGK